MSEIYSSHQCQATNAGLFLIQSQAELNALFAKTLSTTAPNSSKPLPTRIGPSSSSEDSTSTNNAIDFSKLSENHWLVLAAMGQKPSGGYALRLEDEQAKITDKAAILPIVFIEPQADQFQTMALTAPCLLLALEKANFKKVLSPKPSSWLLELP